MLYTFQRKEGFYPIEINPEDHPDRMDTDLQAIEHVKVNPGTIKVINEITGKVVFEVL